MIVEEAVDLGEGHQIEFGRATWNEDRRSVRNRYPTASGGFSPHSSSEIPIEDVVPMAIETLRRNLLDPQLALQIAAAAIESARRRLAE